MRPLECLKQKWHTLEKYEQSALCVLLVLILGVLLFAMGNEIGKSLYEATNK